MKSNIRKCFATDHVSWLHCQVISVRLNIRKGIVSRKGTWSGNPAKSKDFSIVFDYYVGGMLDLAKNDCAFSL